MKLISNYKDYIQVGSNCGTTSTRFILNYNNYKLSEDMIFGLGSGLGFIYQYYASDETYFLSGKNESLENNIANLFGGVIESGYFDDQEKAFNVVKSYIDRDIPVILDLSIRYLPYFKAYLDSLGNTGFGLHNAVLVGYDEEGSVLLVEHRWSEPQKISKEDFFKAWGAEDSGMNPRNAFKAYRLPEPPKNLANYIKYAIDININRMKNPFAYKMGLNGFKTFRKEVISIIRSDKWTDYSEALYIFSVLMEKLGTGGGNFRRIYGRFLREASKITESDMYKEIGQGYIDLSKEWKKLSNLIMLVISENTSENAEKLEKLLEGIERKEFFLIDQLSNL